MKRSLRAVLAGCVVQAFCLLLFFFESTPKEYNNIKVRFGRPTATFCCNCQEVPAETKVGVRDSRALVGQCKHCCIRQVVAAIKVGVRDSRALVCQLFK